MFAISPTDKNWFDFLKEKQLNSFINFWTPTPWDIKNPKAGDRWYFLLKSPIRKIGGFGELVKYENLTPTVAWKNYGLKTGCKDLNTFTSKIQSYIRRNSNRFGNEKIDINKYKIGCIILKNCQFWDDEAFLKPEDFGILMSKEIVTRKIFYQYDPFKSISPNNFNLLNEPRETYKSEVNQRKGQGKFKGEILKAYGNTCCISGENISELLDAAHIQIYLNINSNHIQNGILLRVDLHRLYDNGLLYIDENYTIHVSSILKKSPYYKFNKQPISLPTNSEDHPSREALKTKFVNFRQ